MSLLSPHGIRRSLLTQEQAFNDADSTDASDYQEENANKRGNPYATCFGLPYQDHNYGAPPPPTPPPSPPPLAAQTPSSPALQQPVMMDMESVACTQVVVTSQEPGDEVDDVVENTHDDDEVDDSVTRCICDFQHDDGYMIQCDRCSVWQHVDCMGVDRSDIPEKYFCERCQPRKLNKQRAIQVQTKKRELLSIDTSATESENETKTVYMDSSSSPSPSRAPASGRRRSRFYSGTGQPPPTPGAKKQGPDKGRKKSTDKPRAKQQQYPKKPTKVTKSPVKTSSRLRNISESSDRHTDSYHFADTYEEAPGNFYSRDVLNFLSTRKSNGSQHMSTPRPPVQLQEQLYTIAHYLNNKRGLEAVQMIDSCEPVAEYKGRVMLREQYNQENMFFKSYQPHVLFYYKLDGIDLCVDASSFGNDVRHVRRSCTPNAEVRHFVEGSHLYFYIYSTKVISAGQEITIPYDYNYQECKYGVECACNRAACPVERFHRSIITNTEEIPLQVPTKAAKKQKRMPHETLSVDTSLSTPPEAMSPIHSPQPKRRRLSSHCKDKGAPTTPSKDVAKGMTSPRGMRSPLSPGLGSDGEMQPEVDQKPKMSREERKMEAIMKAFERMEKRQARQSTTHRQPSADATGEHSEIDTPETEPPSRAASRKTSRSNSSKDDDKSHRVKKAVKGKAKPKVREVKEEKVREVEESICDLKTETKEDETKDDKNLETKVEEKPEIKFEVELEAKVRQEQDADACDAEVTSDKADISEADKHKPELETEPLVDVVKEESNDLPEIIKKEETNASSFLKERLDIEEDALKLLPKEQEGERNDEDIKVESDEDISQNVSVTEETMPIKDEDTEKEGETQSNEREHTFSDVDRELAKAEAKAARAEAKAAKAEAKLKKMAKKLEKKREKAKKKKSQTQVSENEEDVEESKQMLAGEESEIDSDEPLAKSVLKKKLKAAEDPPKAATDKKQKKKGKPKGVKKSAEIIEDSESEEDEPVARETRASRGRGRKKQELEEKNKTAVKSKPGRKKKTGAVQELEGGNEDASNADSNPLMEAKVHLTPLSPLLVADKTKTPKTGRKKGINPNGGTSGRRKGRVSETVEATDDSQPPTSFTAAGPLNVAFKFPKTPKTKKHLVSEWLNDRSGGQEADTSTTHRHNTTTKQNVEPLEVNIANPVVVSSQGSSAEPEADFVKCVPSPHAGALSHLRRSSVSSGNSQTSARAVHSIPVEQRDTSMGSAKKRWLRQAMYERSTSSPAGVADKPDPHANTTSPPVADFVTPLKKRRFTREMENPHAPETSNSNDAAVCPSQTVVTTLANVTMSSLAQVTMTSPSYVTMSTTTHVTMSSPIHASMVTPAHVTMGTPKYNVLSSPLRSPEHELGSPIHTGEGLSSPRQVSIMSPPAHGVMISPLHEESILRMKERGAEVDVARMLLSLKHSPPSGSSGGARGCGGNGLTVSNTGSALMKKLASSSFDNSSNTIGSKTFESRTLEESSVSSEIHNSRSLAHCSGDTNCGALSSNDGVDYNALRAASSQGFDSTGVSAASVHDSLTARLARLRRASCDSGSSSTCSRSLTNELLSGALKKQRGNSICSEHDPLNSSMDSSVSGSGEYDKPCSSSTASTRLAMYNTYFSERTSSHSTVHSSQHNSAEGTDTAAATNSHVQNILSRNGQPLLNNHVDSSKDSSSMITHTRTLLQPGGSHAKIDSQSRSFSEGELDNSNVSNEFERSLNLNKTECLSFREAEAKVTSRHDVSDLEEGELHEISGEEVTSAQVHVSTQMESEREEGEITSEDEHNRTEDPGVEEEEVHSSSGLMPAAEPVTVDSSEAEQALDSTKTERDDALPAAYREICNSDDEVSSSRASSPHRALLSANAVDMPSAYRKRNRWREYDRSPVSTHSPHTSPAADSTCSDNIGRGVSARADSSHSPIVSSTDICQGKSPADQRSRSVDEEISPSFVMTGGEVAFGSANHNQYKKKMSLSDYRKRMKARPSSSSVGGASENNTPGPMTSFTSRSACNTPMYPTLPLFPQLAEKHSTLKTQGLTQKAVADSAGSATVSRRVSKDEEPLSKWSATATMAEQLLEQSGVDKAGEARSLTERLRKEFGLEGLDDSDDKDESSDDEPPPPPPPPRTESSSLPPITLPTPPATQPPVPLQPPPPPPGDTATRTQFSMQPPVTAPLQVVRTIVPAVGSAVTGISPGMPTIPGALQGVAIPAAVPAVSSVVQGLPTGTLPALSHDVVEGSLAQNIAIGSKVGVPKGVLPPVSMHIKVSATSTGVPPPLSTLSVPPHVTLPGAIPPPVSISMQGQVSGVLLPLTSGRSHNSAMPTHEVSSKPEPVIKTSVPSAPILSPHTLSATCSSSSSIQPVSQSLSENKVKSLPLSKNVGQKPLLATASGLKPMLQQFEQYSAKHVPTLVPPPAPPRPGNQLPINHTVMPPTPPPPLQPLKGFLPLPGPGSSLSQNKHGVFANMRSAPSPPPVPLLSSLHKNVTHNKAPVLISGAPAPKHFTHSSSVSAGDTHCHPGAVISECKSSQTAQKNKTSHISSTTGSSKAAATEDKASSSRPRPDREYELNSYGVGRCFVCDVELTSQRQASEHLSGRKHIKKKTEWEASEHLLLGFANTPNGGTANGPTKMPNKSSHFRNSTSKPGKVQLTNYSHEFSSYNK